VGTNLRSSIALSDQEIADFVNQSRTATMATLDGEGQPHLVAMWYAVINGQLWFETKAKSQKAVNLRRDGRISVLIEAGDTYDALKGVSLEGRGVIVADADAMWRMGVDMWERYHGPYTEQVRPHVEASVHKRVAVRVDVERTRSWDHGKLGMDAMSPAGNTAAYL
jgi:PPOX class probable F420-dependent enzyme